MPCMSALARMRKTSPLNAEPKHLAWRVSWQLKHATRLSAHFNKTYKRRELIFDFDCAFDYIFEKVQDLPLRKTKDFGDLYEADKKALSKIVKKPRVLFFVRQKR